jgi:L-ascorbate metabolism protein UlaG (beta-lactamase superfamily)
MNGSEDLDWWESKKVNGVTVTFAPAQHWSVRGIGDRFAELWGSFYFSDGETSVYFAGDTGWGPHFAQVRDRLGAPTVALLPIGAYLPRWFMHSQHMDPGEAVAAHRVLGATTSIAIHWGTFAQSDEGMYQPAGDLRLALQAARVSPDAFVALENGDHWEVSEAPTLR